MQELERNSSLQRNSLRSGQPPGSPFQGAESEDDDADVQEVEMVLETYFMHIDNTYNKLQTLTEYIDDTEVHMPLPLSDIAQRARSLFVCAFTVCATLQGVTIAECWRRTISTLSWTISVIS